MNYWHMQQLEWISKALCWVKETSLKRLHAVWFHLYDISGCQGLRWDSQGLVVLYKGIAQGSFGDYETVLNSNCGAGYLDLHMS